MNNLLQVILDFKANLNGLDRFVSAYKARMEQVEAFNARIQNGEAALRGMLTKLGSVLGAAALYRYTQEARAAEEAQNELTQALRRTGQVQYRDQLLAQADALEEVTKFSAEQVQAVQRITLGFGLSAQQAQAAAEPILDWAQQHRQAGEAAAQFFGEQLASGREELARYGIELDQSKDRVTAMIEAFQKTSGGAARAAIVNKEEHQLLVQYGRETEKLGNIARAVALPFIQVLVPALGQTAQILGQLAGVVQPFVPVLAAVTPTVLKLALAWGALSGSMTLVKMAVNPLRTAFVLLTGTTIAQYGRALTATIAKHGLIKGSLASITSASGLAATALRLVAVAGLGFVAFMVGWLIGSMINELEVGGARIKDWVAKIMADIAAWWAHFDANVEKGWNWIKLTFSNSLTALKVVVLEFLVWVADKFDNALGRKIGFTIDPTGLKDSLDQAKKQLADSAGKLIADNAAVDLRAKAKAGWWLDVGQDILDEGKQAVRNNQAQGAGNAQDLTNLSNFDQDALEAQVKKAEADRKAAEEAQLERKRKIYAEETKAQRLEADGDQEAADAIRRRLREMEAEADLGADARDLIRERLDLEDRLTQEKRAQQAVADSQAILEKQLNRLQSERQLAEQRRDRTTAVRILEQEQVLIGQIIAGYQAAAAAAASPLEQAEALAQIAQWQQFLEDLKTGAGASRLSQAQQNYQALDDPIQHFQSLSDGSQGGILEYLAQVGTTADQVAEGIKSTLGSAVSSITDGISSWINGTLSFGAAAAQIGQSILNTMLRTVVEMGVQWLVNKALVLTGMTAIETAADAHRVARVAKENAAEAATLPAKSAGAVAAGISSFGIALAFGAVALAAIMAAFGAFETGGVVRGGEQLIRVNEKGTEAVLNNRAYRTFGETFIAGLNTGQLLLDALPGDVAHSLTRPADPAGTGAAMGGSGGGASGAQAVNVAILDKSSNARAWLESSEGSRFLYDKVKGVMKDVS
ncbi:hypothetical protein H5P28_00345 [Ruficoccus amylovorans]|uniref:Phage tail tape measure protein n=1 Tax=Ruficoccus amylovorans TaxID=1804625 RepID=A0A842HB91_9BACT|nr:phage tail tape measure C-terminal domain-containing protein [Ruficoccus amylovorans]MBC2592701.1 hypothetical protein [Ruficoccus amylovorans]